VILASALSGVVLGAGFQLQVAERLGGGHPGQGFQNHAVLVGLGEDGGTMRWPKALYTARRQ
jgi:hypothetical protein